MLNFNISIDKLLDIANSVYNIAIDQRKARYTNSYVMILQKDYEISFITNYLNIGYKKSMYSESSGDGWCIIDISTFYKNIRQYKSYIATFYPKDNIILNVYHDDKNNELNVKFSNTTYKFVTYNNNELYTQFIQNYNSLNYITFNYEDYTSFTLDKLNYFNVDKYKLITNKTHLYNNISPAFFYINLKEHILYYIDNRYPEAVCCVKLQMNILKQFEYDKYEANIPLPIFKLISFYKSNNYNFIFVLKDKDIFIIRDLINDKTEYHATETKKNKIEQTSLFIETTNNIKLFNKKKKKEPDSFNDKLNLYEAIQIKNCRLDLYENILNDIYSYNNLFSKIEFNFFHLQKTLALFIQAGNYRSQEDTDCTIQVFQNRLYIRIKDNKSNNKIEQTLTINNLTNSRITVTVNLRAFIRIIKSLEAKYKLDLYTVPKLNYYLSIYGNDKTKTARLCIENKELTDNKEINNCYALIKCKLANYYEFYSQTKEIKNNEN